MAIRIDKKPSHKSSGSSEDNFLIGNPNTAIKEYRANVPGDDDPAIAYDANQQAWFAISTAQDRLDFIAGTLTPMASQGVTGIAGIDGQTGPQGVTGMKGPTGMEGTTGFMGTTGHQGFTGTMGDTGLAIQGDTGLAGAQGDTGLAGAGGSQGATGVGTAGAQGDTGLAGAGGSQGATGIQGVQGDQGVTGAGVQGDTGVGGIQCQTGLSNQETTGVGSPTVFVSTEQTGTALSQSIAHGLGVVPSKVLVSATDTVSGAFTITEGAHDATDVFVTMTTGIKYKVLAMP